MRESRNIKVIDSRVNDRYDAALHYNETTGVACLTLKDKIRGKETSFYRTVDGTRPLSQAKREMLVASGIDEMLVEELVNIENDMVSGLCKIFEVVKQEDRQEKPGILTYLGTYDQIAENMIARRRLMEASA
jgi:hypothetical protein